MEGEPILVVERLPNGDCQVYLGPEAFSDPMAWAIVIADLTTHVTNAYASGVLDRAILNANLRAAVRGEWNNPTATPREVKG